MESRSGSAPAPRAATKGRGSSTRESSYAATAMTTSSTAIMAHLPMAMLASAIGASTRAVAALHRSTGTLDAAPAPGAGPERLQSLQELLGGEEVTGERYLVDVLRRETVCYYPPGGVHDLRASSIVERDVDVEAVVTRGEDLSLLHCFQHRGRQMLPSAQKTEPGTTLVQLRHFLTGRVEEELHERLYLSLWTCPVLGREGIEDKRLHPGASSGLKQGSEHRDTGPVACRTRKPASLGPAPVAVHNDGHVTRSPVWVEDARLGGICGESFLEAFQKLDLRELGFLVGEDSLDSLDVAVCELL